MLNRAVYLQFQGISPESLVKVDNPEIKDIIEGCTRREKETRFVSCVDTISLVEDAHLN